MSEAIAHVPDIFECHRNGSIRANPFIDVRCGFAFRSLFFRECTPVAQIINLMNPSILFQKSRRSTRPALLIQPRFQTGLFLAR